MFIVSKIVAPFVLPLGGALAGLVLAVLLTRLRLRRTAHVLFALCVAGLWAASMPVTARTLAGVLQGIYPPVTVSASPGADAIVLLGGAVQPPVPPRTDVELNAAADRIMHAADLYKAGKAPVIIASGGSWGLGDSAYTEAAAMREVLEKFGVPADAIVLEPKSRNTHENARFTARILKAHRWTSPLLVTSAIHMPRAVASFAAEGVKVIPSATDLIGVGPTSWYILDWLPDAQALSDTSRVLKEVVGFAYYRVRGWA